MPHRRTHPVTRANALTDFEPFLRARGVSLDTVLEGTGLTRHEISDPEHMVSLNAVAMVLEAAARETGDPCLGLHWAESFRKGATGVIGYLLLNAKTVRSGLKAIARYIELHIDPIDATFEERDGLGNLEWRFPPNFTAPRMQYASFVMAVTIIRLRKHAGEDWMPMSVELEHRALDCPAEAARILGPNVKFDQPHNALRIRETVLNRSSPEADLRLFGLIRDLGDRLMAERRANADIVQRTAKSIMDLLQEGEASLDEVAGQLSMTARGLQTHLADAGTNFDTVLHETRQSLAATYLRDTDLPLTEIAFLLGFSELSAFTRAANRWFGVPPRQYRQDLRSTA